MENKHNISPFLRFGRIFKSKTLRSLMFIIILSLNVLFIMVLDTRNNFEDIFFPHLGAFYQTILTKFKLTSRIEINVNVWYVYALLYIFAVSFLVGEIYKDYITRFTDKYKARFSSEEKAKKTFTAIYWIIVALVAIVLGLLYWAIGAFNPKYFHTIDFKHFVLQFLLMAVLTVAFVIVSIIFLYVLFVVVQLLAVVVAYFINSVKKFDLRIEDDRKRIGDIDGLVINAEAKGGAGAGAGAGAGYAAGAGAGIGASSESVTKRAKIKPGDMFPSLTTIDLDMVDNPPVPTVSSELTLEEFVLQFQSFAINKHKIYYELPLIRSFLAGMAVSRLIILEGLSGTGKSMLPRMFCEFTGSKKFFSPVQATWRDKTDLLGFYSEFTKTFKTTDFLINLYDASYTDKVNLMVLDEMNLSRIEYYFADFLSILEYPSEDWKVKVYEPDIGQELPSKLTGGYIQIPNNTWFIGTANTDDSTFTITDKVYDRAMVLDFKEKISPITSSYNSDPIQISSEALVNMFNEAKENINKCLSKDETDKFLKLCDFMRDAFDIRFGNRIMVQIQGYVPVYVALGGSKEEALDDIFATKIMRKLDGVFEDYIKDELAKLIALLHSLYGKGTFVQTERAIEKILKRLV